MSVSFKVWSGLEILAGNCMICQNDSSESNVQRVYHEFNGTEALHQRTHWACKGCFNDMLKHRNTCPVCIQEIQNDTVQIEISEVKDDSPNNSQENRPVRDRQIRRIQPNRREPWSCASKACAACGILTILGLILGLIGARA